MSFKPTSVMAMIKEEKSEKGENKNSNRRSVRERMRTAVATEEGRV